MCLGRVGEPPRAVSPTPLGRLLGRPASLNSQDQFISWDPWWMCKIDIDGDVVFVVVLGWFGVPLGWPCGLGVEFWVSLLKIVVA